MTHIVVDLAFTPFVSVANSGVSLAAVAVPLGVRHALGVADVSEGLVTAVRLVGRLAATLVRHHILKLIHSNVRMMRTVVSAMLVIVNSNINIL